MQYLFKVHNGEGLQTIKSTPGVIQINGFSVTTTSGTVQINWGDGESDTLASGVPISHTFFCPNAVAAAGFWNNIEPCPGFDAINEFFMFKVHDRENLTVRSKNLSRVVPTAPFLVLSAANRITGGLYYEPPIPSVTYIINYTSNVETTAFIPGNIFGCRPRCNTFRTDGSFVVVVTATSAFSVTMPMDPTVTPPLTAGIDLFFGDFQNATITPNVGWFNRPGTLNPNESAVQFTINTANPLNPYGVDVGRVTTWNNIVCSFNITINP